MNVVFLSGSQRDEPASAMNLLPEPGCRSGTLTRAAASVLHVTAKAWAREQKSTREPGADEVADSGAVAVEWARTAPSSCSTG
jgi:hypothetical protein